LNSENNLRNSLSVFAKHSHPRNWSLILGFTLLRLATRLPYSLQMNVGAIVGRCLYYTMTRRRQVAQTNTSLVFPELSSEEQKKFVKDNFISLGMSLFEVALSWWGKDEMLRKICRIEGLENLHAALGKGKGVILLSGHFTCLEIGGRLLSLSQPFSVTYRSSKNEFYEAMLKQCREQNYAHAIQRHDVRAFIRSLKANEAVWYAPDQDFGARQSVFVPFMGVMAASLTAPARFAKLSGALIVPFFPERLPDNKGYKLTLLPALKDFPSGDEIADARRINEVIEEQIRKVPEQYLWVHRRFKTQAEGVAPIYNVKSRRRKH